MLVKTFPEYFGTYQIYEVVKDVLEKNMRKSDIKKVLDELERMDTAPENFLKNLALVIKKHVSSSRASSIIMGIKNNLSRLIDVVVEDKVITVNKNGKGILKVSIGNNLEDAFKFRVAVKQMNRTNSAIIYNPVKNYCVNQLIKSAIINSGKAHTFKFIIKPDIFEITDLYELKKDKKIEFNLATQAQISGIDGLKTPIKKIKVIVTL